MTAPRVLVISPGDPHNPRSWSGTPHQLCAALAERDALSGGISTTEVTPAWARLAARAVSKVYYPSAKLSGYGRWARQVKGAFVARAIEASDASSALHLMTTHLPFPSRRPSSKQYLYVDTSQRLWTLYSGQADQRSGRMERDVHRLERQTFAQMDHVFTISEYLRQDLITHYGVLPEKVSTVGSGRGKMEPWLGAKDYRNGTMLYVALGWAAKGGQLALDAFILARRRRPELRFVMVCEPQVQQRLLELSVPGLEPLTQVSWEQLQQLYRDASLFVMPALHQPWGLAYLEALSCATPIVGLDRLSTPELTGYGRFGWVLKTEEPNELANVMISAYDHPERLEQMGRAGQRFCLESFGWDKTVDRIITQISRNPKILGNEKGSPPC